MATKTEGGREYPSDAYLVVPDADKPSTWKLRIWETPETKITIRQLGRAAAALGPGFRGRRVQLSKEERDRAIRKLRSLYKSKGVEADDLPPVLKEAAHGTAQRRMLKTMRRAMEHLSKLEGAGDDVKTMLAEAHEDLEIVQEAYHSIHFISAQQDNALSFESLIHAAEHAVHEWHKAYHSTDSMGEASCSWHIVATFPAALVYEHDGKLYQVGYQIEGTMVNLSDDEHVEVTAEFVPVAGEGERESAESKTHVQQESSPRDLYEAVPACHLSEAHAKLNRADRVIEGTVLVTSESANGVHGRRHYPDKTLQKIAQMAEGLPAYVNHVPKEQAFKPRDVRELIGRHRNVRFDAANHRVVSDLHVLDHHADWVFALAEEMADVVGNSVVARGYTRMDGETEVVEEIVALRSADLVSDPGATKGLFEYRERWTQDHPPTGGSAMDEKKVKDLEELLKTREVELAEVKAKLSNFEAAEAKRQKADRLEKALAESRLGKEFKSAITVEFKSILMDLDEARWSALIEDRVKAVEAVKPTGPMSAPKSASLMDGNGLVPSDAHARLAQAIRG